MLGGGRIEKLTVLSNTQHPPCPSSTLLPSKDQKEFADNTHGTGGVESLDDPEKILGPVKNVILNERRHGHGWTDACCGSAGSQRAAALRPSRGLPLTTAVPSLCHVLPSSSVLSLLVSLKGPQDAHLSNTPSTKALHSMALTYLSSP